MSGAEVVELLLKVEADQGREIDDVDHFDLSAEPYKVNKFEITKTKFGEYRVWDPDKVETVEICETLAEAIEAAKPGNEAAKELDPVEMGYVAAAEVELELNSEHEDYSQCHPWNKKD